jgi:hypothetical protein
MAEPRENIFQIKDKYKELKKIAGELHWMARRYADGRQTCATHQFNEMARKLLEMGVELNEGSDGTIWARDAMGRQYDGLSEEEALQGKPLPQWREWEDEELASLRAALSFYGDPKNYEDQAQEFAFKEYCSAAVFKSCIQLDRGRTARAALRGKGCSNP